MDQQNAKAVTPLFPQVATGEELTLGRAEYETLSRAFQKFHDASLGLQVKYEELKIESQGLRDELKKKEIEIKRNERLATLGETAAALAHEIRNPLGAISLYTSLLKEDLSQQPEQHELVTAIDNSISTLNHVVSNILHFAKSATPVQSPLSLASILQEIAAQQQQVHENAKITLRIRGNLFVWADGTAMRQLFTNLILNALQAQGPSGIVTVIAVGGDENVFVRVRDNGPGIDPEALEQIFEPFTTSKPEGTGLGLAICREIAKSHSATIIPENRKKGAQFTTVFQRVSEK
jgi:signal transduction histidine kinase